LVVEGMKQKSFGLCYLLKPKKILILLETFCKTHHKQNKFQQLKETKARLKNTSKNLKCISNKNLIAKVAMHWQSGIDEIREKEA